MAKERLSMPKIKEVLRLRFDHQQSARQIAKICGIARSTVKEYLDRVQKAAIPWPLPPGWDDATLENRLFPPIPRSLLGSDPHFGENTGLKPENTYFGNLSILTSTTSFGPTPKSEEPMVRPRRKRPF
jgi:hypothetical protein